MTSNYFELQTNILVKVIFCLVKVVSGLRRPPYVTIGWDIYTDDSYQKPSIVEKQKKVLKKSFLSSLSFPNISVALFSYNETKNNHREILYRKSWVSYPIWKCENEHDIYRKPNFLFRETQRIDQEIELPRRKYNFQIMSSDDFSLVCSSLSPSPFLLRQSIIIHSIRKCLFSF